MSAANPRVDFFFAKAKKWQEEFEKLRLILLGCRLTEELKWGQPCYSVDKGNVVLIHGFKDYCALLFFKGVLLKDDHKLLVQQTKNVQAARQIRFTSTQEIVKMEKTIRSYVKEAILAEKVGLKVKLKNTKEFAMPDEFKSQLDRSRDLKRAFASLTPGRQRGYLLYFSSAKQPATRAARVEKYVKQILKGKGLEDK